MIINAHCNNSLWFWLLLQTIKRIPLKLCCYAHWLGPYHVCSNGHAWLFWPQQSSQLSLYNRRVGLSSSIIIRPSTIHIFDFFSKPSARSTSNLVGMCFGWASAKLVQMVTVLWFLDFETIVLFGGNIKEPSSLKPTCQVLLNCKETPVGAPKP